jgi:hypothetical protein
MNNNTKKTIQKMKDWIENIFYRDYGEEQKEQRLKLITIDKTIEALKEHIAEQTDEIGNDITETKGKIELLEKYRDRKPPYNNGASDEILTLVCYRSLAYCVPGDTKILMWDFTWKSIKDIAEGETTVGLHRMKEKGRCNYYKIVPNNVIATGNRMAETLIIKTKDGQLIQMTPEHPMLCETKGRAHAYRWRKAEIIKEGDVARFFIPPTEIQSMQDFIRGWLSGYSQDGCFYNRADKLKQRQFKIMSIDDELLEAFDKRLAMFGIKTIYAKQINSINNSFSDKKYYNARAIYTYKDAEKLEKLCRYDTNGSYDYHCGFLGGIFDANGTGNNMPRIYETNKMMIANICNSLKQLNFRYTVTERKIISGSGKRNSEIRVIGGAIEMFRFVAETKPVLKRKIKELFAYSDNPRLPKLEVISVRKGKKIKVYNLETETKNYIANGFIVHNCCGLKKACVWRDSALNLLEISAKDYERMKKEFHDKIMDGKVVHDKEKS